jgi:hypothetical protein
MPLPPPPKMDKSTGGALLDKHANEDVQMATQTDNNVDALRAYRRAHGLCQYCAEKYSRGHKCAPTVQLQAVHELWGLFNVDSDSESRVVDSDYDAQVNMLLPQEIISSNCAAGTLKFMGQIQGHTVVALIDSGSSHSFIISYLSGVLSGIIVVPDPIKVRVASGQIITCQSEIKKAEWLIQDHQFMVDLKLILLPYYDIILGIDWLLKHSPMNID